MKQHEVGTGVTQEEVARALGLSKMGVQKIEQRAIRKARRWCELRGLRFEDLVPDAPPPDPDTFHANLQVGEE